MTAATITSREAEQVAAANASGLPPVVFVHGLWLLAGSWDPWKAYVEEHGYAAVAVDWPGDEPDVASAREHPDTLAGTSVADVADHVAEAIGTLDKKPVLIGHSFGGLLVQMLAGRGLAAATVSIDPAPSKGVLPLPLSTLKASFPVLGNPLNRSRTVTLTFDQFRYGFANAVPEEEAHHLYDSFHVPAPGRPLFQAGFANFNPWAVTKADKKSPERGPMLLISGGSDHIVPLAITKASYNLQRKNQAATELVEIPGVGHSLVIDSGWPKVAEAALDFAGRQGIA